MAFSKTSPKPVRLRIVGGNAWRNIERLEQPAALYLTEGSSIRESRGGVMSGQLVSTNFALPKTKIRKSYLTVNRKLTSTNRISFNTRLSTVAIKISQYFHGFKCLSSSVVEDSIGRDSIAFPPCCVSLGCVDFANAGLIRSCSTFASRVAESPPSNNDISLAMRLDASS